MISQIFDTNQREVNDNVLPFEYILGIDEAFNTDEIFHIGFHAYFLKVQHVTLQSQEVMLQDNNQLFGPLFLFLLGYFFSMQNYEELDRYVDNECLILRDNAHGATTLFAW